MKIENDVIIEATEAELMEYYLKQELDLMISFKEYKETIIEAGTLIKEQVENIKPTLCSKDIIEYCKKNGGIIDDIGELVFITNMTLFGKPIEIMIQRIYDRIRVAMIYDKVQNIRIHYIFLYNDFLDIEELFSHISRCFKKEVDNMNSKIPLKG